MTESGNQDRKLGERVLDVVFVADCSGSMIGERIGALNWAARTVVPTLQAQAEDHPGIELRLRVLQFSSGAAFVTPESVPIGHFFWANLVAQGESDMGAAFRLLAESFAREAVAAERLPPVVVLFSDGYPSDDAEGGLEALLATELGRRAIRIPIAIGQDADMDLLRRFSSDPSRAPLRSQDVEMLVARMRWVVAGPVTQAIANRPDDVRSGAGPGQGGRTPAESDAGEETW